MTIENPLSGLTVVEIGHSVAAPYAGLVLAELGADVIKVENPARGDYARGWGPPFWNGNATAFHALNRGKSGITIDFGDARQAAELRRLIVDRADVVIQNLRAGVVSRHGLGADELIGAKPSLIYCEIGAFGDRGPLSNLPGYDPLMQAFAGIMSVTGEGGDRPPVRVGVSMIDMGAGLWATIGILSAVIERARTGKGGLVSTSLYETALAWMAIPMAGYQANGDVRRPYGSAIAEVVPYQCFMTAGGWLMIAAGNDNLFRSLCRALDRADLADDRRFLTNADRVVNRDVLLPMLEAAIGAWPLDELSRALDAAGIPNAPLQAVDQVARHPQTEAIGIVQRGPPGALPTVGVPLRFDGARPAYERGAPILGEHDDVVFGSMRDR